MPPKTLEPYARLASGDVALQLKRTKDGKAMVAPLSKWGRFKVRVLSALGIKTKAMRKARGDIHRHFLLSLQDKYGFMEGSEATKSLGTFAWGDPPPLTANKVKEVLGRAKQLKAESDEKNASRYSNRFTSEIKDYY